MRHFCLLLLILALAGAVVAQSRITDLSAAHAATLEEFLSGNKNYDFLSDTVLDADYLGEMRKAFDRSTPYYTVGDFNHDGIKDFAVILSRKGTPTDNGEGPAETHRYDHPLAIVIFNGDRRGKFTRSFVEKIEAPLVCFLNTAIFRKRKRLYFTVFETDADTRVFEPTGKGYIVRSPY